MAEIVFTNSQSEAISSGGTDLLVSAAAGSGKTATLTERIIRKIENSQDISRMLVVTFTKAAANELKSKIAKRLEAALRNNPDNPHLSRQITLLGSADICTIDSFCFKLVKRNFSKLGIDSDIRIMDESESLVLANQTMLEVLDDFYESETENKDFFIVSDCFSNISDENSLANELLTLYNKLISTSDSIETLLHNTVLESDFMDTVFGKILKDYLLMFLNFSIGFYNDVLEELEYDVNARNAYYDNFQSERRALENIKDSVSSNSYLTIKKAVSAFHADNLKKLSKETQIDKKFIQEYRQSIKKSLDKIKDTYFSSEESAIKSAFTQNEKICKSIYNILQRFEEEFSKKKRAVSACDFNDVERFALSLLYNENGDKSDYADEVANCYDEIYIDEYQDTNSVQDRIFSAISKNNRFMVGDVKQSIYRFRSAEPEIFSGYRQKFTLYEKDYKGKNGQSVFMSENFRCDPSVIDFSNKVSDYMFSNSFGIDYRSEDRLVRAKDISNQISPLKCEICLIDNKLLDDEKRDSIDLYTEEEITALKIRDMIDNGFLPDGTKIKPSDIAILLRNLQNKADKYISALNKYGIKTEYVSRENFFKNPEILLVLCILNILDNPNKDSSLAGALLSFVFNFSLEDLIKIKKKSSPDSSLYNSLTSYDENDGTKEKINSFRLKFDELRNATKEMPSHKILSYLYSFLGISGACSKTERKNLLKFYDMARRYESNSFKGLYSFIGYIENLSDSKTVEEVSDSKDCVKVMSVHASKGLEFNICFLCNTETAFRKSDSSVPIVFNRKTGVCGYIGRDEGLIRFNTLIRKCASLGLTLESAEEEMRILYVAMTRAKSQFIVMSEVNNASEYLLNEEKGEKFVSPYKIYSSNSFIKLILGAIHKDDSFVKINIIDPLTGNVTVSSADSQTARINENEVDRYKSILKNRMEFVYPYDYLKNLPSKLSISELAPGILDSNVEVAQNVELREYPSFIKQKEDGFLPAEVGTSTHVFLQFCNYDNLLKYGVEYEIDRLKNDAFISADASLMIDRSYIEKFINSQLFSEITNAKKITREFRFNVMLDAGEFTSDSLLAKEKILVQGVIDLLIEDKNSDLVLVDYKTDKPNGKNFEQVLINRHSLQLSYYRKALELMLNRQISKVLIYSVPLAKTVEIQKPSFK